MPLLLSDKVDTQLKKLQELGRASERYNPNDIERICNHAIEVFKDCVNQFAANAITVLYEKGPGYLKGADDFVEQIKIGLDKAFTLKSKLLNEISRSIRYIPGKYLGGILAINNLVKEFAVAFQDGNADENKLKILKNKLKEQLPADYVIDGDNADDPEKIVYQRFYDWLQLNPKINHLICYESLEISNLILVDTKIVDVETINGIKVTHFEESVNTFIEVLNKLDPQSQDIKIIMEDLKSIKDSLEGLNKSYLGLISIMEKMLETNSQDVNNQLQALQKILQPYNFAKCSALFEYVENYLSALSQDKSLKSQFELMSDLAFYVNKMADDFSRFEQIKDLMLKVQEDPASAEKMLDTLRNDTDYSAGIDESLDICQSILEMRQQQGFGISRKF